MHNFSAKSTSCKASRVIDSLKNPDPLVVRKKIELSDTYFRRGCPEHEVVRAELAVDTEICVALAAGVIAALAAAIAVSSWRRKRLKRKYERKCEKAITKATVCDMTVAAAEP